MGYLENQKFYLAGSVDLCPDLGIEWRRWISGILRDKYKAIPYNPMDKPIEIAGEMENRQLRKEWKKTGQYDKLSEFMRLIRRVDLRMTDKSDAGIFYIDIDIHACGTYEELSWMNRCKRPCLVVCKQGIANIPDWIFGITPVCHMFNDWNELFQYLDKVDSGWDDGTNRWLKFNY